MKDSGYPEFVLLHLLFNFQTISVCILFPYAADPPCITTDPKELKDVPLGQAVTFTIDATGTEPINYQRQWKPPGRGDEVWQECEKEWSRSTTLEIPSVQRSHKGSYRCAVSNHAGRQTSKAANLCIGKNPCFSQLYENISAILLLVYRVP